MPARSILLIAGEVSGDMLGAGLVRAVRARDPALSFFGIGGDECAAAGMDLAYHVRDMAVMGVSEVLRKYGFFLRALHRMTALAAERKPDAVVLVDYPGFNLRFAARAHAMGLKVVYYVCPQVWAWNRGRIPRMARVVDRLIAIFPFEQEVFRGTGLRVDFVGHPLVDQAAKALAEPPAPVGWRGEPRVALLPGSRRHEIERILPVMWGAAALVERRHPGASFIIASPGSEQTAQIRAVAGRLRGGPTSWAVETGLTRHVLRQARAALVASGTATVEAALMRCPMAIAYKVSALTYLLGRLLVRVPNIGMVNIVAGATVCPEFVQGAATPEALAGALWPLLEEGAERHAMLEALERVANALGAGGAEARAAEVVLDCLRGAPVP